MNLSPAQPPDETTTASGEGNGVMATAGTECGA